MAKGKMTEGEWLNSPAKIAKAAQKAKKSTAKKGADGVRDFAFLLYMQRVAQGEIAERCNVSQQTVSAWKQADNWEAKRAAQNISIETLVSKAMMQIDKMLDLPGDKFNADAFAKAVAQLKSLKTGNTTADFLMCFMAFQDYLMARIKSDGISPDFIKLVTKHQDAFIHHKLGAIDGQQ